MRLQRAASSEQLSGSLRLSLDKAVEDSAEFLRIANEGPAEGQTPLTSSSSQCSVSWSEPRAMRKNRR